MNLLITSEQRFHYAPDETYWSSGGPSYTFWKRYLEVFDEVNVLARCLRVPCQPKNMVRANGPRVNMIPLPFYIGPMGYIRVAYKVRRTIKLALNSKSAVILRVPSLLSTNVESGLKKDNRPFGVEVVGDPDQVFARNNIEHPFRWLFRIWFRMAQERQCNTAGAVAYVTQYILQNKYPSKAQGISVSDVDISDLWIADKPKICGSSYQGLEESSVRIAETEDIELLGRRPVRLILVGSLEQLYKGADLTIRAVKILEKKNHNLELVIVGEGKYLEYLKGLAKSCGVGDRVIFRGRLATADAVRAELDSADLFVMPSRTEGLPRAMIEAMARGLPCIGTDVGGVPELLSPEDLVQPGGFRALANKIDEVLASRSRMQAMAERNLAKAKEYHVDILRIKRNEFFSRINTITEEWYRKSS